MKLYIYCLSILFLLYSSCSVDNDENNGTTIPSKSNVVFQITENDDNNISNVDILAFRVDPNDNTKEYFAYRAKGQNIQDNEVPNKKEFVVSLLKGGSTKYRFVVLANASDQIDALGDISTLAQKKELLERLLATNTNKWVTNNQDPNYVDIPMWGESTQIFVNDNTQTITGINLVRMLARVDVVIDGANLGIFKLRSVRVYNYNTTGYIVPNTDPAYWDGTNVLRPTVPSSAEKVLGPLVYNELSTPDIAITKGIYLFEATAGEIGQSSKTTCLVIGGEYNNEGKETFYRIDLAITAGNGEITYLDILRNNLYNVRITRIDGTGYDTPEDAFNSQPINIEGDITVWGQGGLSDIIFDGQYHLSVSQSELTLPKNQRTATDTDNKLTIVTDNPEGWTIEKIVDIDGNFIPASWLTVSRYIGSVNVETTISLLADENITGVNRTAYIYIKAGRLAYVVKVIQTTLPELGLDLIDVNGLQISYLIFQSHVGGSVPSQQLNVRWVPKSANPVVSIGSLSGASNFDFGTGDRIDAGNINGADGLKTYSIQPPPMTQAEIDANPFLEKAYKIDYTVSNGTEYESKTLFLMQKNYAAIPSTEIRYYMDGTEKSLTINANAPWQIEVTNDPKNIIQNFITTSGGQYGDKRDEKVYFTPIDDMTNLSVLNGDVTFTIKSTDPNRPFPDKTVTLRFISAIPRKRLLTIGNDPNGFGYNFSGTAASNKLITTTSNFGILPESVIKAEGFTIINGATNPTDLQMQGWLITNPVDIVIIGYDNANLSTTVAGYYAQFLNNGGVVLAFQDRTDAAVSGNLLRAILGNGITISYATGAGSVYQFSNLNDEVLVGPFGDIRNKQWGEDASSTVRITGVNAQAVDILSGDRDISTTGSTGTAGYMTAFKHKTLNFIWAGDGGFNSNHTGTSATICPFKLDGSNFPAPKDNYGRGVTKYPVYNSTFAANAIAWALKKSEFKRSTTLKNTR